VESHPKVSEPVVLRDLADREYSTRVEDLGVGLVVVARPRDLPADETFANGTAVSVTWVDSGGDATVLPTKFLSAHAEGPLELWSLIVTGPAVTEQRRRSDRVPASGPVTLRSTADSEADAVLGEVSDVSGGGIRCAVEAGAADVFLTGSNQVVAEFALGAVDFAITGRVEFLRATSRPAEFEDLVVVFDEPVADADALREQLLAQQTLTPQGEGEG